MPTDKSGFPVKRIFATKGSELEKTSFGDGASLLGSLDAAVNTDVIVLNWGLPKISGIDLLVNSAGLARFLAAHATFGRKLTPKGDRHEICRLHCRNSDARRGSRRLCGPYYPRSGYSQTYYSPSGYSYSPAGYSYYPPPNYSSSPPRCAYRSTAWDRNYNGIHPGPERTFP